VRRLLAGEDRQPRAEIQWLDARMVAGSGGVVVAIVEFSRPE